MRCYVLLSYQCKNIAAFSVETRNSHEKANRIGDGAALSISLFLSHLSSPSPYLTCAGLKSTVYLSIWCIHILAFSDRAKCEQCLHFRYSFWFFSLSLFLPLLSPGYLSPIFDLFIEIVWFCCCCCLASVFIQSFYEHCKVQRKLSCYRDYDLNGNMARLVCLDILSASLSHIYGPYYVPHTT